MFTSIAGRAVVVTGATRGIGKGIARVFAGAGARVLITGRDEEAAKGAVAELAAAGGEASYVLGDVSRREDVRKAVELAIAHYGHLDVAVQVAGIADFIPFLEVTDASWDRILDVNLRGTWYLVQEAGRAMVRQRIHGAIAITASTNAFQPEAGGLCYNTSKSGQVAVMHTAALELIRHGIRVNALAPGIINTRLSAFVINNPDARKVMLDRIPIGRFAEPEEMARPILWMCSDDASYLSGELLVVDGAMTAGIPEPGTLDVPMPGVVR